MRTKKKTCLIDVVIAKVLPSNEVVWHPTLLNPFKFTTKNKELELRLLASNINPHSGFERFVNDVKKELYGGVFEEIKEHMPTLLLPLHLHYNHL